MSGTNDLLKLAFLGRALVPGTAGAASFLSLAVSVADVVALPLAIASYRQTYPGGAYTVNRQNLEAPPALTDTAVQPLGCTADCHRPEAVDWDSRRPDIARAGHTDSSCRRRQRPRTCRASEQDRDPAGCRPTRPALARRPAMNVSDAGTGAISARAGVRRLSPG